MITINAQVVDYITSGELGGVAGASGATMAVMGFTVAHIASYYAGYTDDPKIKDLRLTLFGVGVGWAGVQLISDFYPGWSLTPSASGIAHLLGFLLGIGYADVKIRT